MVSVTTDIAEGTILVVNERNTKVESSLIVVICLYDQLKLPRSFVWVALRLVMCIIYIALRYVLEC